MAKDNQDQSQQDPEQIRREIEETRARMSGTLSALETKFAPDRLKQQASDTIRQQTVGRVEDLADSASRTVKGTSADVFETIKQNPLPAALAAIGLGWLFMERRSSNKQFDYQGRDFNRRYRSGDRYGYGTGNDYGADYRFRPADRQDWESGRQPMDRMRGAAGSMQDKASDMASNVQGKASDVASNVQDKASQVASSVQDTAGQVADTVQQKASQFTDQAQQQAYQVKSRFEDLLDQNPLLVGAAAVALGAAVGMALPQTPQEHQLFGEARDNLMEKAQSTAQDTLQKAQNVAQKAGDAAKDAAKDEAQKQNLTTSS